MTVRSFVQVKKLFQNVQGISSLLVERMQLGHCRRTHKDDNLLYRDTRSGRNCLLSPVRCLTSLPAYFKEFLNVCKIVGKSQYEK